MATKSRTYLPTDWTLWAYKPVSGKFRLDFSAPDGADVLGGATDLGSVQVLPLRIGTIQLDDGQQPDQSVFSQFTPGTMALSAQLLSWDATTVKELYNGKQVFLTLKNEATNSHPTFGKNTVFFIGQIDSLNIQVDPINSITNLTITATDVSAASVNFPVAIAKSTTTGKAAQITSAFNAARDAGQISSYLSFSLYGTLGAVYETNVTETKSLGDWIQDYLFSEVATFFPGYFTNYGAGVWDVNRGLTAYTITANSTVCETIPYSMISNMAVTQDGANVPTAFNMTNSTATYSYGSITASTLSNPTIYSGQLDVPTSFLPTIANKILQYTQNIQPTEITVRTAQAFQTITFDNSRTLFGTDYFFPKYYWRNGQEVKTIPTYLGGNTYYHQVVGTSHTITPDDWQTTYQLWKGLNPPALPTNYVTNGSATSSTDFANWYGTARTTSTYNTSPASWVAVYDAGNDWYQAEFYKASALTISTYYSLSFWAKSIVPGTVINASILAGSNSSNINITPSTSTWTYYKIENIQCIGSAQLDVVWNAPSNAYYIDDVWVVSGPTAYL